MIGTGIAALLLNALPIAAPASKSAMDAARKQLAPTGSLRAAVNYNNPVLAKRNATTNDLQGLAVDLSAELARRVGAPLELIPFDSANKILAGAAVDAWDVGFLAIDPLRANDIDFSPPYVELEGSYLVANGSSLRRLDDVDNGGVRIAVTRGSAYDLFLSRALKRAQLVRADTTPQSFDLMRTEGLEAAAAVRSALVAAADLMPGSRVLEGHFMTIPQAVGVPKSRPAAALFVRAFVEEMKSSGFIADALQRHGFGPDDALVVRPIADKPAGRRAAGKVL